MAKEVLDVRAMRVVALVYGDPDEIELVFKLVTLLADRRRRPKSTRPRQA